MREAYVNNKDFREYVDRYAICRRITVDEALTHELVRLYLEYLGGK